MTRLEFAHFYSRSKEKVVVEGVDSGGRGGHLTGRVLSDGRTVRSEPGRFTDRALTHVL